MEKERVSKPIVIRLTKSPDQGFTIDNKGWLKGKMRLFSEETAERIEKIFFQLKSDPHTFYT